MESKLLVATPSSRNVKDEIRFLHRGIQHSLEVNYERFPMQNYIEKERKLAAIAAAIIIIIKFKSLIYFNLGKFISSQNGRETNQTDFLRLTDLTINVSFPMRVNKDICL